MNVHFDVNASLLLPKYEFQRGNLTGNANLVYLYTGVYLQLSRASEHFFHSLPIFDIYMCYMLTVTGMSC